MAPGGTRRIMPKNPKTKNPSDKETIQEKVVMHLLNGRLLKGTLTRFSPSASTVQIRVSPGSDLLDVSLDEVKAIFYVKSYAGNKDYRERKKFGLDKGEGHRIMVRFKDGEILVGRTHSDFSEKPGSLAAMLSGQNKGFEIYPADPGSNNSRVFVVTSSLVDVRYL